MILVYETLFFWWRVRFTLRAIMPKVKKPKKAIPTARGFLR